MEEVFYNVADARKERLQTSVSSHSTCDELRSL